MTDLSSIKGGGVVSVQTGYVAAVRSGTSASDGELSYLDVTLPTALNTDRPAVAFFEGVFSSSNLGTVNGTASSVMATARVFDSTTVRIGSNYNASPYFFVGRWTVIEYA